MTKIITWENFGKLSLVLGVIVSSVYLYDIFSKESEYNLNADISFESFHWPTLPDKGINDVDSEIYDNLKSTLSDLNKVSQYESKYLVGIHNNGNSEALKVHITLPHTISYKVIRNGFNDINKHYNDVIKIDDIQPTKSAYIIAWVNKRLSDEDLQNVRASHSKGSIKINPISSVYLESNFVIYKNQFYDALVQTGLFILLMIGIILMKPIQFIRGFLNKNKDK